MNTEQGADGMAISHILVLDFDGTVCVGDQPVLAYGHQLARQLHDDPRTADVDIEATLRDFLTSPKGSEPAVLADAVDGYAAAQTLGRRHGLTAEQIHRAFQQSRRMLDDGLLETSTPKGLPQFLADLPATVHRVLVTNAPLDGVASQLEKLGVAPVIDHIVTDAHKPAGSPAILTGLLAEAGLAERPESLLSVGDVWTNDLAPALALGCRTAFIDRRRTGVGTPSARGETFEELYAFISSWAATPVLSESH